MFLKTLVVVLFGFLLSGVASAQEPALNGKWEGKVNREGRMQTLTFQLKVQGEDVTGTVLLDGDDFGDVEDGKLTGNTLSFHCNTTKFNGNLAGQELRMTITVFNGNKFNVTATRKS